MEFEQVKEAFEASEDVVFEWSNFLGSDDTYIIPGLDGVVEAMPVDIRAGQELREAVVRWTAPDGHERFFRKTGSFTSWDGYRWDGPFEEVFPKEVVVTQWTTV